MPTPGDRVSFGIDLEGVLFLPNTHDRRPAVIILHERYGLVRHTLDLAARLATDGYVALAPNLFSRWQGDHAALARGDVRVTLPDPEIGATISTSIDFLRAQPRVRPDGVMIMGVCQSGRYPIAVSNARDDVAACVVFYGAAQGSDWRVTDQQPRPMAEMLSAVRAPCLFVFGKGDHIISIDDVLRVRAALESGRRSYRMRVFRDVPHGWLNTTMPGRYRPEAAEEAWSILLEFLGDVTERGWPGEGRVRWEFESDTSTAYDFSRNIRLE